MLHRPLRYASETNISKQIFRKWTFDIELFITERFSGGIFSYTADVNAI